MNIIVHRNSYLSSTVHLSITIAKELRADPWSNPTPTLNPSVTPTALLLRGECRSRAQPMNWLFCVRAQVFLHRYRVHIIADTAPIHQSISCFTFLSLMNKTRWYLNSSSCGSKFVFGLKWAHRTHRDCNKKKLWDIAWMFPRKYQRLYWVQMFFLILVLNSCIVQREFSALAEVCNPYYNKQSLAQPFNL